MFPFEPLEVYTLFDSVLPTSTGIYAICNIINCKYYIGSARGNGKSKCAKGFRARFYRHRTDLIKNRHHCKHLQSSYNYYVGELGLNPNDVYQIWILEYVEIDGCIEVEDEYLKTFELSYNHSIHADAPMKGSRPSVEVRKKISKNSKSYLQAKDYVGISPTGEHIFFTNSLKFIKDHPELNISQANLSACARGVRRHCLGWRFFFREDYESMNGIIPPLEYLELGKQYVAISPDGERIEFANARQFCRDYPEWKFNHKNISSCVRGDKKSHKGWKFYSKEDVSGSQVQPRDQAKDKYIGITPTGGVVTFDNVSAFVRDNPQYKFHTSCIWSSIRGRHKNYKKWKFYYAEDYYQSAA
jgi:hypothetical protein